MDENQQEKCYGCTQEELDAGIEHAAEFFTTPQMFAISILSDAQEMCIFHGIHTYIKVVVCDPGHCPSER